MKQGPMEVFSRPISAGVEVGKSCLIATLPRSGSWLLSEALAATKLAGQPAEYFRPDFLSHFGSEWGLPPDTDLPSYIAAAKGCTSSGTGVFSNKFHRYQFEWLITELRKLQETDLSDDELIASWFPDVHYIYLRRNEKDRQALSYYLASRSNAWFEETEADGTLPLGHNEAPDLQQVRYFEDRLHIQEQKWQAYFASGRLKVLLVEYERFADAYGETLHEILAFLGIESSAGHEEAQPGLRRQSDERSEAWLEEYRSVRESLEPWSPELSWSQHDCAYVRARVDGLPLGWRRWAAKNSLLGIGDKQILETVSRHGFDRSGAAQMLATMRNDDLYPVFHEIAERLRKLETQFSMLRELSGLSTGPAIAECREDDLGDFIERFYSQNAPCVIRGLAKSWPAMAWTPDTLKDRFGELTVEVMAERESDPLYEIRSPSHKRTIRFTDYVDQVMDLGTSNDVYLVANNHFFKSEKTRPLLEDLGPLPGFLERDESGARTFLWFGPAGTVTPLHHDSINILFVQLAGRKTFLLASVLDTPHLYNWRSVYSAVDPEAPDLERFPRFAKARIAGVNLEPGDSLFIPVGWWHHVRSQDISISTSFTNFRVPNNYSLHRVKPSSS